MDFKIDSHKLNYHPYQVGKWLNKEKIFPISVEISPSGACNHRCVFCSQSYLGYKTQFIDSEILISNIAEMHNSGTKSIVIAGEGEPLLHPQISTIIDELKRIGVDVAISTNAALFTDDLIENILHNLTWIRISLNAYDEDSYSKVHGTKKADFYKVLNNIKKVVSFKKKNKLDLTIGIQYVLYNDNADINKIYELIKKVKAYGVDYFSLKPYSVHPLSDKQIMPFNFDDFNEVEKKLESLASRSFSVIIRKNAIKSNSSDKEYSQCLGIPFWSYIDSHLNVWPCLAFIGVDKFKLGNLYENTYLDIVNSNKYDSIINHFSSMDISACRKSCRLESINKYLQDIIRGIPHINFI